MLLSYLADEYAQKRLLHCHILQHLQVEMRLPVIPSILFLVFADLSSIYMQM